MEQSDYESDEDEEEIENRLDKKRLRAIKTVLFNTHRANTGADKLSIPAFINILTQISTNNEGKTFS